MQVSPVQDALGRFAVRHPTLLKKLARLETRWLADAIGETTIDRPIYVAGLARSGSTLLLEFLAAHAAVASHQYKDFPFVQIPYWWNWFVDRASARNQAAVERAHKDRILVSPTSPEAMEEMIWMAFFPDLHNSSQSQVLTDQEEHAEFEKFYRDHIRKMLVVKRGERYVAKGNYNVSRLEYLARLFPHACFIIPVRDPVHHIASLMKQQHLFCELETRDPEALAYMQRVGHFEFGLDRRPINFGQFDTVRRIERLWFDGKEAQGWAAYWASVYAFVADVLERNPLLRHRSLVVNYSDLCKTPAASLQSIYSHCELEVAGELLKQQASQVSVPRYYEPKFTRDEMDAIHKETGETLDRILRLTAVERQGRAGTCTA